MSRQAVYRSSISRRRFLQLSGAAALAAACAPAAPTATGTATSTAAAQATGQAVVMMTGMDIARNIHIIHATFEHGLAIASHVTEGLTGYSSKDLSLYKRLASDWKISDDRSTITFTIRNGVKFSDGTPLTAEDAYYSLNMLFTDKTARNPIKGDISTRLKDLKVVDPMTLQLTTDRPWTPTLEALARIFVGPKRLLEKDTDTQTSPLARVPVGTGAYRVTEHAGDDITFEWNPEHWGTKAKIAKIVIRAAGDAAAITAALRAGEVDAASFDPVAMKSLETDTNFRVQKASPLVWAAIILDHANPLFQDKNVRQAMLYALNRENMIKVAFVDNGVVVDSMFAPGQPYYNAALKKYPYDPKKAQDMLSAAGWTKNAQGVLQKDGKPFSFQLAFISTSTRNVGIATLAQQDWKQVGIDAQLFQTADSAVLFEYINRPLKGAYVQATGFRVDPVGSLSSQWYKGGFEGGRHYNNAAFDALVDQAGAEFDSTKKTPIMTKIAELQNEELPDLWIGAPVGGVVHKVNLKGINLNFGPGVTGWMTHIEEWSR